MADFLQEACVNFWSHVCWKNHLKDVHYIWSMSIISMQLIYHRWHWGKIRSSIGNTKISLTVLSRFRILPKHSNHSMLEGDSKMNLQLHVTREKATQLLWQLEKFGVSTKELLKACLSREYLKTDRNSFFYIFKLVRVGLDFIFTVF